MSVKLKQQVKEVVQDLMELNGKAEVSTVQALMEDYHGVVILDTLLLEGIINQSVMEVCSG